MTTYARRLGLFSTTMAVVGGIIGGGIFRTPAAVAGRVGSPGLALAAWVVGGVVALIGALCYGELGHRRPRAGGGYVYLREAWGALPGVPLRLGASAGDRHGGHRGGGGHLRGLRRSRSRGCPTPSPPPSPSPRSCSSQGSTTSA